MSKNLIKSAYTKGYNSGRRHAQHDQDRQHRIDREQDFWERAYLAALPVALSASGWTIGDKSITSSNDRNHLAGLWADTALRERRKRI